MGKYDPDDFLREHGEDALRAKLDEMPPEPEPQPGNGADKSKLEPLPFVDMSNWDNEPVPKREWAVLDRIPMRHVTLFSGEGAVGKSIVELQLACAHVLGRDWLGSMPDPGPAIYYGCEDEEGELHRRVAAIASHYRVRFSDLIRGGLLPLALVDDDPVLAVPDRSGKMVPTKRYEQMLEAAGDIKPKHIGIDTSADVFGGKELDRAQVRQFVAMLRKIARKANGSVVLLAHPSLTGINSGTGLSGSTGWHNSVRARMYLTSVSDEDDADRQLEFKKNQYGRKAERLILQFKDGIFAPVTARSATQRAAAEQSVDDAFLRCLEAVTAEGINVNAKEKSRSQYAPRVFEQMPQAGDFKASALALSLSRLLKAGIIKTVPYGPASKDLTKLVVTPRKQTVS